MDEALLCEFPAYDTTLETTYTFISAVNFYWTLVLLISSIDCFCRGQTL